MPISSFSVYKYGDINMRITSAFFYDDANALDLMKDNEESAKAYLDMNQQDGMINMISSLANSDNADNCCLYDEIESVIKDQSEEKLKSYLNICSIPFSITLDSLTNIMICQGKTKEEITETIIRVTNNYNLIHNKEGISDRKVL